MFLAEEEAKYLDHIQIVNTKKLPDNLRCVNCVLVTGSVVVANDIVSTFLSSLKGLLGGELKNYTLLCDTARSTVLVRLIAEADSLYADKVYNLRFETAFIHG